MGRKTRYIVSVTRLNIPYTIYASVPCEDAAHKLAEKATELGYPDVAVFSEKDYRKAKNAQRKKEKERKDATTKCKVSEKSQ